MSEIFPAPGLRPLHEDDLPDGWKARQLGDLGRIVSGGRLGLTKERDYRAVGIPAFSAAGQDGFVEVAEFHQLGLVIPSIGSIGRCFLAEGSWTTLANTQALLVNSREALASYLVHRLDNTRYWPTNGTAQPFVKPSEIPRCWVALPPLSEQRRIAEILDALDAAIRSTERLISKLAQMKQGLVHDLLTRGIDGNGELRDPVCHPDQFRDTAVGRVPTSWEVVPLARLCSRITYGFTNPMPGARSGPWMLTAADIGYGFIDLTAARRTTESAFAHALSDKSRPERGDLLITKDGTLGRVALLDLDRVCVNQSVAVVRPRPGVSTGFMTQYLLSTAGQEAMLRDAGGSTIKHLYVSKLGSMEVPFPPKPEADQIVSVIEQTQTRFEREFDLLDKLRVIKLGLMDDLLSGRVRANAGNEGAA